MIQIINQGLLITVLGMSLVFVMIIALWGIMALLVNITSKKNDKTENEAETLLQVSTGSDEETQGSNAAAAAAAAVAYALLKEKIRPRNSHDDQFSKSSTWLAIGRLRQTLRNPHRGR